MNPARLMEGTQQGVKRDGRGGVEELVVKNQIAWNYINQSTRFSIAIITIIFEAKEFHSIDTCLGQLKAYMEIIHAARKGQEKRNSIERKRDFLFLRSG